MLPVNPLPDDKILDWSKLKQFADDNFKFDENSRKFSKRVENTVGKGEIVHYEQFLIFPQCFQKTCFPGASKGVIVWEWVNTCFQHHIIVLWSSHYRVFSIAFSLFRVIVNALSSMWFQINTCKGE